VDGQPLRSRHARSSRRSLPGRTVTDEAKIAGATREGFRLIRKRDEEFAALWDDAYEQGS
jgi:hypothetical protein